MIRVRRLSRASRLGTVLALAAAGCNKKAPAPAPAPPPPPPAAPATPPPPPPPPAPRPEPAPAPRPLSEEEVFSQKSVDQLNAEHLLARCRSSSSTSRRFGDQAKPILQKDADWLKRWASAQVTVEGHCDSRGSAEYNLGLGSRRANAIKDYLVSLGVPADAVTVVSKGKEQPVCTEEDESCWQQNRRGHFVITGK